MRLLSLYDNSLTTLPSGLLNGLSNLRVLYLEKNALTALPSDLLAPVRGLEELWARNNALNVFPPGFFAGKPELNDLQVYHNPGDPALKALDPVDYHKGNPLGVHVFVQPLGHGRFRFLVPVGTAFETVVTLSVTNGTLSDERIKIPAGRVESDVYTVTRRPGMGGPVSIDIADVRARNPDLRPPWYPRKLTPMYHNGIVIAKAGVLPVEVLPATAPVVAGATSFTVTEGETAVGTLTATDDDTGAEDLAWSLASGADRDEFTLTAAGTLSFGTAKDYENPDDGGADGTYNVTVEVSDGTYSATADLTVSLANRNEAPSADAGADQTDVEGGSTVTLSGSGSDPDAGDTLTYAWSQTAGTSVILASAFSAATTFSAPSDLTSNETLTFRLRVMDAGGLSAEDETNVTVRADTVETALTASFVDMPASHTGATFTFGLAFSEEIDNLSYKTLRDHAFEVTGGAVRNAQRREPGKNRRWTITVEPGGQGDVAITLPETTDCAASGAICTGDGRPLSHSLSATVPGPVVVPTVSVSDASASEGEAVEFAVSLSAATSEEVTVGYATSGGTATSGTDFTEASGTLTFGANETAKTVSVSTTDDSADEADETFTLTLSGPADATLEDSAATGTIVDDDEVPLTGFTLVDAGTDTDIGALTEGKSFTLDDPANGNYGIRAETAADAQIGSVKLALSGAKTVSRTENIAPYSLYGDDGTNVAGEGLPAGSYALTATAYAERGGTGDMLGTLSVSFTVAATERSALTASFTDMPRSHGGTQFTFGLTFSEEFGLSYKTLRDHAFEVAGGEVRNAQRQQQGSNLAWTISVEPASATDTVTIRLPAATDCAASGAICTDDGRPLSHSLSATVVPASASASRAPSRDATAEADALSLLEGLAPDEAAAALFGESRPSEARLAALDRLGNGNGRYDLGDLLSWRDVCRSGVARCGGTSSSASGPALALLLLLGAAAAGSRRRRWAAASVVLVAAVTTACAGDLAGPPAAERDPAPRHVLAAAPQGPGLLTVAWTAPAAGRVIGVLLELEGPGIDAVRAPGRELYQSDTAGRLQIVVMGDLGAGPLLQFRVPDRARLAEYRIRVRQVAGEDYRLRAVGEYRAAITH